MIRLRDQHTHKTIVQTRHFGYILRGKTPMKSNASFGNTMIKTATVLVVMTLLSKLLGFGRELVIASAFGTSYVVDAYVLAQSIPGILMGGILTSIGTAYIPVYSEVTETLGQGNGNRYTSRILNLAISIALVVFILGLLFSNPIAACFTAKFSEEGHHLTVFFLNTDKSTSGSCSLYS